MSVLARATRPLSPIDRVMASPPTYAAGAGGAASTVYAGKSTAYSGGQYQAGNRSVIGCVGQIVLDPSAPSQFKGQNVMESTLAPAARRGGYSQRLYFCTNAPSFDICMFRGAAAQRVNLYVTDLATGVRARALASDATLTEASQFAYYRWDFGAPAARMIELVAEPDIRFRGLNVGAGYTIWKPEFPDSRIFAMWDSYGGGTGSTGAGRVGLGNVDYIGEQLGSRAVISSYRGGTGFVASTGSDGTFVQRLQAGDADRSRVGRQDVCFLMGSINDNASWTDAVVAAAAQRAWSLLAAAQPDALIIGAGPMRCGVYNAPQSRYDALKTAFKAAAGAQKRFVWIDNSPAGENWWAGAGGGNAVSRYMYVDNAHYTDTGKAWLGRRIGMSAKAALRTVASAG